MFLLQSNREIPASLPPPFIPPASENADDARFITLGGAGALSLPIWVLWGVPKHCRGPQYTRWLGQGQGNVFVQTH